MPRLSKNLFHLLRITRILTRYGLHEFISAIHLFRSFALLFRLLPVRCDRNLPRGERLRLALEELGPVFVKFGQMLSTRPDLLPEDVVRSLTRLQDSVPPFPGDRAIRIIEEAYGDSIADHFTKFQKESTASASVAQVHYAELHDGTEVIVKVVRPDTKGLIERDIALLYALAELVERHLSEGRRLRPVEIVADYDRTIHDELDMMREAANASQLKANFQNSDKIHVPEVMWEHTNHSVLVMERVYGIPIRDVERLKEVGIDMRELAHAGVEIFFTQAFRDGFFHADMHPGNIFVSETGQYRAVDFGIMGTLGTADKRYLAENLLAFFNRDYHGVAEAHIRAGWVPPDTNAEQFEAAIRTVCEPIFSLPLSRISFGRLLLDLFRIARSFNMPVQPQLVLLQKTILNIEGLGRQLYPDLNLWETGKPLLEQWMHEQIGPRAAMRTIRRELPNLFTLAPELPALTHQILYRLKNNELTLSTRDSEIRELKRQLHARHRRNSRTLWGILMITVSLVMFPIDGRVAVNPILGDLLLVAGLATLIIGILTKSSPE